MYFCATAKCNNSKGRSRYIILVQLIGYNLLSNMISIMKRNAKGRLVCGVKIRHWPFHLLKCSSNFNCNNVMPYLAEYLKYQYLISKMLKLSSNHILVINFKVCDNSALNYLFDVRTSWQFEKSRLRPTKIESRKLNY